MRLFEIANEYKFVNSTTFTHETSEKNAESILRDGFRSRMDGVYFNVGEQSFTNGHYGGTLIRVSINIPDSKILFYKDMPIWVRQKKRTSLADYCRMHGYSAWADNLQINVFDFDAIKIIEVVKYDKNS